MIEIIYDKDKDRIFNLTYEIHKYIPDSFVQKYPRNTELHYMYYLLGSDSNVEFIGTFQIIWSTDYKYKYKNKEFTLVFDEDYSFISYVVENPEDIREIAEYISEIIESHKI